MVLYTSNGCDNPPEVWEDDCGPFKLRFDIYGISSSSIVSSPWGIGDIFFGFLENDSNSIVAYDSFGIVVDMLFLSGLSDSRNSFRANPFITNAYACSPGQPYSDERISNINIFSTSDYDSAHPAGDTLTDLILVDYLPKLHIVAQDLSVFLDTMPSAKQQFAFFLKSPPDSLRVHRFIIQYQQTNGEFYSLISNPVFIKP